MKLKKTLLLLPIIILSLLSTKGASAQQGGIGDTIDTYVRERMEDLDIPGAALAIVRRGEIVHLAGYGAANEAGDPVTPQTPFLLASFSKSMTAVAVMQLVEAGKVELDAPIQQVLPWFMPDTPITVRQLLNQTSGLDELHGYERNLDADGDEALAASVRRLATADLNRPPGTAFEYSNSNYDILGLLIETVTGQSYGDYMQANLFEPLAMTDSFTSLTAARAEGMTQAFYPFFGRQTNFDRYLPYSRATQPSAGNIGSAEDMAHFLMFHLNDGRFGAGQLLSPSGMETLHALAVETAPGVGYGMGWSVWFFEDAALPGGDPPKALSHGGEWLGFNNLMLFIPEHDLGIVLLMNGNNPAYANVAFNVALLALGQEAHLSPPLEGTLDRHIRLLTVILILLLLIAAVVALRRLRRPTLTRRDGWLFIGLAIIDLALLIYILLIRLPQIKSSVPLTLRFEPDMGLMLLVILFLTAVWGSLRSLWAIRSWRATSVSN
jgi:CubicO group peptidase (beta-lactamase class C family)